MLASMRASASSIACRRFLNGLREGTGKLAPRDALRGHGLCRDHRGDGFRLGKVQFAVDESALGKLAGARHPCPGGKRGAEHPRQSDAAAVALQLDDILAGERVRSEKNRHQPVVYQLAGLRLDNFHAPKRRVWLGGEAAFRTQDTSPRSLGFGTGDANDADPAGAVAVAMATIVSDAVMITLRHFRLSEISADTRILARLLSGRKRGNTRQFERLGFAVEIRAGSDCVVFVRPAAPGSIFIAAPTAPATAK
jgi:hypothetical protein